ncbi:MAG: ribosome recycling factor [Hyphomicrobiales bacterium]|nr:ribosome recycling factor [Hyphomicrobiales bacterium]OQW83375.1 MAG: ribosome recycling factor [Proteobacteria bacterium ST_bin15]
MAVQEFNIAEIKRKMQNSLNVLKGEFAGLRTGRASPGLLDPIMVDAYGSKMALKEVATVSVPESRMLSVQVWDKGLAPAVDKAIRESNLGLNPMLEGAVLRIPIPELSKDRRQELVKAANRYAEAARVAVRHVRRDGMDHLKKLEKDGHKSEDDIARLSDQVQKATDEAIAEIDKSLAVKEKDVMQV